MKKIIFAMALSVLSLSAQAQQIIETKLDLGTPKIDATDFETDKFSVKLTISPRLISSSGAAEPAAGATISAQIGVWTHAGGRPSFFTLESSTPQQITADPSGKVDHHFVFSKNELATLNSPICLSVVVKAEAGPEATRLVCAD